VRKNLFGVISRTGPVAVEDPFIQLGLDPWDGKPSKNEAKK